MTFHRIDYKVIQNGRATLSSWKYNFVLLIVNFPVKNVTGIFSCLFDDSLVENDIKTDGNPIIFLTNTRKFLDLNLCKFHVMF